MTVDPPLVETDTVAGLPDTTTVLPPEAVPLTSFDADTRASEPPDTSTVTFVAARSRVIRRVRMH